jgi:hypothetical protein
MTARTVTFGDAKKRPRTIKLSETRPIVREAAERVKDGKKYREIKIQFGGGGDTVRTWLKGTRIAYSGTVGQVYRYFAKLHGEQLRKEKAAKKAAKKAGQR